MISLTTHRLSIKQGEDPPPHRLTTYTLYKPHVNEMSYYVSVIKKSTISLQKYAYTYQKEVGLTYIHLLIYIALECIT